MGLRCVLTWLSRAAAVLLMSSAPTLTAQVAAWPLDGSAFSAPAAEIAAAARSIPTEKYAPITVLYEEEKQVLDAAGRMTSTHHLIYRLETQQGVEAWSEASAQWEAFYQNQPSIRARVIRPDGTVAELDPKTLTDVPARNEGEGTYSDDRIHKAPLPALGIGAIVELETVRSDKEPFFSDGGTYRIYIERDVPIVRSRLIVEAPLTLPLQYRVGFLPDLATKKEESNGIRHLTFDQGRLAPAVNGDIHLATRAPRSGWIEYSTGKSWQAIVEAYSALAEPQIQTAQAKEIVGDREAPSTGPDRLAFIQTLVSRLHKEVRYTGIEFGESKLQPQTPSEILKRHYGDCKDKAALLVAMLRATGIPAHLALLDAGPGRDVTPELPGMNQFDHAIAYVSATSAGDKALWIDATAEFTQVGNLPFGDQGRLALIIAPGSHDLTLTPEARPEDSVLVESREFSLADYGPAHITESSQTTGYVDALYRSNYGELDSKQLNTSLETYAHNVYAAKDPARIEHSDARDFSKPFVLRIDMARAARGTTSVNDAAVAVYPTGTFATLPRWFGIDPDQGKLTPEQESDRQKAEQQRSADYDIQPFIAERRYRIVPPAGFLLRSLPANKTRQMGPATLTETYSVDPAGVVTASLRFNSGKSRYTTDEALALRKAVLEANKEDAVMIMFDQAGARLIAAGKIREALATDRALVNAHSNDALAHVRMAYALLQAGVGEQAHAEAIKATVADPKSAVAFNALGWVLQFNDIGMQYGKGFDLNGAIEAYKKAKQLDPEDLDTRSSLAVLYEYDTRGVRYSASADLKSAIQEYRDLKQQDKAAGERLQDNLLFAMLYAHDYKAVLDELASIPSSPVRNSVQIAATVAADGVDAGLKRADRTSGEATQRNTALRNAGSQLIALRLYPQATAILSAGMQGQEDAAGIARQIEIFRNLQPYTPAPPTTSDAASVIRQMMIDSLTGNVSTEEISRLVARYGYATDHDWQMSLKAGERSRDSLRAVAARSGLPPVVLADVSLGTMKLSSDGNDASGFRITMQTIGTTGDQYFVVKEHDGYKIIAQQRDIPEVGNAALYLVRHGREAEARALLDWKRDDMHKGGGDDPLDGPLLPRLWTSGESKGSEAIEIAAASLLTYQANISDLVPAIVAARDRAAAGTPAAADLDHLLALAYLRIGDAAHARAASEALLKDYPDSITAIRLAGLAYALSHDWTAWNAMLDRRLARHHTDRDLLLQKAEAEQYQSDFAAARKTLRTVLDSGQATSNDYNEYGWNALFEATPPNGDSLQAAQQGNMLSKNSSFAELHTLACVYAAQGKTTEAKEVLLQAMSAANLTAPDSATWFAFGAIYEQYGVQDAATQAFQKVEKPEGTLIPTDTWVLAQAHLKTLQAKK